MMETFSHSNIKHGSENLLSKVSISNITWTSLGEKKNLLPIWQLWWYWSVTKAADCWLMLKLNVYDRNSSSDGWLWICWTDKMLQCLGCLVVSKNRQHRDMIFAVFTWHNIKWWSALNLDYLTLTVLIYM